MTVILTISNHAAINVAKALMDRNIIGFKLTMSRSAFDIATKGGNKDLIKLSDAKKVWLPHEAVEEAKRDPKRSATKLHKDVLRRKVEMEKLDDTLSELFDSAHRQQDVLSDGTFSLIEQHPRDDCISRQGSYRK